MYYNGRIVPGSALFAEPIRWCHSQHEEGSVRRECLPQSQPGITRTRAFRDIPVHADYIPSAWRRQPFRVRLFPGIACLSIRHGLRAAYSQATACRKVAVSEPHRRDQGKQDGKYHKQFAEAGATSLCVRTRNIGGGHIYRDVHGK